MNLYGNSVGVISIESQTAVFLPEAASSELSPDNQSLAENVETATPNISDHRQLPKRRITPD